jgi:peptidoglycan hydrolase-like protein with peptidoglycan-binding domain
MANIAKHLNINIPSPGSGGDGKDKDEESADPNAFPGNITQGQRGEHVKKVQKALNHFLRSFKMSTISEDGIFGPQTGSALIAMKQRTGRPAGAGWAVVDEPTWNHLKNYFHSGGLVGADSISGQGDSIKKDEISAVLQKGEYVINRRAVSLLGTDFLDRINSVQTKFSSPRGAAGTLRGMSGSSTSSTTNTYNLSFHVDGGNIDEQKLAQKVVFEIKKMERDMGMGRRVS